MCHQKQVDMRVAPLKWKEYVSKGRRPGQKPVPDDSGGRARTRIGERHVMKEKQRYHREDRLNEG